DSLTANLLFAFDSELELNRQLAARPQPRRRAEQVGEHLAFVIRCAAGIDVSVALRRLKRWADPLIQWLDRLHIVVAINQNRRLVRNRRGFAIYQRLSRGFDNLGRKTHRAKLSSYPFRRTANVGGAAAIGADARDFQQRAEVVLK